MTWLLHVAEAAQDHAVTVAKSGWAWILLSAQAAASVVGLAGVLGAEVNDTVLAGVALFVGGIFVSIIGWSLVLLVRMSNVVSRLEEQGKDHERRIRDMERPD